MRKRFGCINRSESDCQRSFIGPLRLDGEAFISLAHAAQRRIRPERLGRMDPVGEGGVVNGRARAVRRWICDVLDNHRDRLLYFVRSPDFGATSQLRWGAQLPAVS